MQDFKWTGAEKRIARAAFEAALQKELAEILAAFKAKAAALPDTDALWSLLAQTDRQRAQIDRKYDFRYSQLIFVFGLLLREGRITAADLHGLAEDKLSLICAIAQR